MGESRGHGRLTIAHARPRIGGRPIRVHDFGGCGGGCGNKWRAVDFSAVAGAASRTPPSRPHVVTPARVPGGRPFYVHALALGNTMGTERFLRLARVLLLLRRRRRVVRMQHAYVSGPVVFRRSAAPTPVTRGLRPSPYNYQIRTETIMKIRTRTTNISRRLHTRVYNRSRTPWTRLVRYRFRSGFFRFFVVRSRIFEWTFESATTNRPFERQLIYSMFSDGVFRLYCTALL